MQEKKHKKMKISTSNLNWKVYGKIKEKFSRWNEDFNTLFLFSTLFFRLRFLSPMYWPYDCVHNMLDSYVRNRWITTRRRMLMKTLESYQKISSTFFTYNKIKNITLWKCLKRRNYIFQPPQHIIHKKICKEKGKA